MNENNKTSIMADQSDDEDDHGIIRPIEKESVQRIVAGQAVSDLASAVKELVDNALDAGSTSINSKICFSLFYPSSFCVLLSCPLQFAYSTRAWTYWKFRTMAVEFQQNQDRS